MLSRLIVGLLAYALKKSINEYNFGIVGAILALIGFVLSFAAEYKYPGLLYPGSILIGIGSGVWWVIAPMIIMSDAGPGAFGALWGITLTSNFFGMFSLGLGFALVWESAKAPLYTIYPVLIV